MPEGANAPTSTAFGPTLAYVGSQIHHVIPFSIGWNTTTIVPTTTLQGRLLQVLQAQGLFSINSAANNALVLPGTTQLSSAFNVAMHVGGDSAHTSYTEANYYAAQEQSAMAA